MTYKHTKFEDSPIMRSLERVAQQKGLIKPDAINKVANSKLDLTPSSNLMDNIFKLCAGLRAEGMHSEAAELEANYLNYKQAQTLYQTSKETGEDLVNSAHPNGSHHLEGVDGNEAVVETILDRHLKTIEMLNKKPTGKLSNANQILKAVKIALAEDNLNELYNQAISLFDRFNELYEPLHKSSQMSYIRDGQLTNVKKYLDQKNVYSKPYLDHILPNILRGYINDEEPGLINSLNSFHKIRWENEIVPVLYNLKPIALSFSEVIKKIRALENAAKTQQVKNQYNLSSETLNAPNNTSNNVLTMKEVEVSWLSGEAANLIGTLQAYQSVREVAKDPEALDWTKTQIEEIEDIVQRYNNAKNTGELEKVNNSLQLEMKQKAAEVEDFAKQVGINEK